MPEDHKTNGQPADDLLTKEDIGQLLKPEDPLSVRSVERYIEIAGIEPAVKGSGRGKKAKFRRDDVEKIKAAYLASAEARQQQPGNGLTTARPTAPQALAVSELMRGNVEGFALLRDALDTWPVWLTRDDALRRTGVPVTWFDAGVRKNLLRHVGAGRGRRFHRADVRGFAEMLREESFREELLKKPKELAAAGT